MILLTRPPASAPAGHFLPFYHRARISTRISTRMSLTPDQLQRIALLARIDITPEESQGVTERLNRVLGLIDQLQAVDTQGIEPMSHALDIVQRLRPDVVTEENRREAYQKGIQTVEKGLYLVPKAVE